MKKILFIDDEDEIRYIISFFQEKGYNVFKKEKLDEAKSFLQDNDFDNKTQLWRTRDGKIMLRSANWQSSGNTYL